jgi:large subunit ribosomal protein L29
MKIKELKSLTGTELEAKGHDFRQELFNLRVRQSTGQLDQPSRLRELKKGIARVETLLNQAKRKQKKPNE